MKRCSGCDLGVRLRNTAAFYTIPAHFKVSLQLLLCKLAARELLSTSINNLQRIRACEAKQHTARLLILIDVLKNGLRLLFEPNLVVARHSDQ